MFCPISRIRLGPHNACISCLASLTCSDLFRPQQLRLLSSTQRRTANAGLSPTTRPTASELITIDSAGTSSTSTDLQNGTGPQNDSETFGSPAKASRASLGRKTRVALKKALRLEDDGKILGPAAKSGKKRKGGPRKAKSTPRAEQQEGIGTTTEGFKTELGLGSNQVSVTIPIETPGLRTKKMKKEEQRKVAGFPTSRHQKMSIGESDAQIAPPSIKHKPSRVTTVCSARNVVSKSTSSTKEESLINYHATSAKSDSKDVKAKQRTSSPLIRRASVTAKSPDIQRLITKSHMLWLNEKGGLSDPDKLQIMEHLRKSIEDESLKDVVAFTKQPARRGETSNLKRVTPRRTVRSGMSKAAVRSKDSRTDSEMFLAKPTLNPIKQSSRMTAYEIETIRGQQLDLVPVDKPQPPVPKLSYGLERVLFNPGVYHLQDPRSRVFNFDPYLQSIMPVTDFDFNALKEYITSSRDNALISTAVEENKKYTGSTSSMTSALAHFHFLLSQWRPINTSNLSQGFPSNLQSFTAIQRTPSAIFLRRRNGTYAIDADKEFDTANILMMLGKSMEKLLTLPTEEFEKYRKANSNQISEDERQESESYHYTTMGDFLMRSQLDAYDPRLPGTGMFDLKTRAVVSIRMDATNFQNGLGYEIRSRHGEFESYEREYYDMIRSAFLKYSLQVRMGRMDGIFVAFHNTERIFGFQYISLPEMDLALHGTDDLTLGDTEFKISLELLNRALDRATTKYPEQSLRLHFETRAGDAPFMYIFAEPVTEREIDEIQAAGKSRIEEFEQRVLGLDHGLGAQEDVEDEEKAGWGHLQAQVEKEMEIDELGLNNNPETNEDVTGVGVASNLSLSGDNEKLQHGVEEFIFSLSPEDGDAEVGEEGKEANEEEREVDGNETLNMEDQDILIELTGNSNEDMHGAPRSEEYSSDVKKISTEADEVDDDRAFYDDIREGEELPTISVQAGIPEQTETPILAEDIEETESLMTIRKEIAEDINDEDQAMNTDPSINGEDDHSITSRSTKTVLRQEAEKELLAMTLTIRNKVNGLYVERPQNLTSEDEWDVEYALAEVSQKDRARTLYRASQARRAQALNEKSVENNRFVDNFFRDKLRQLSSQGREWRSKQDKIDEEEAPKVLSNGVEDQNSQ